MTNFQHYKIQLKTYLKQLESKDFFVLNLDWVIYWLVLIPTFVINYLESPNRISNPITDFISVIITLILVSFIITPMVYLLFTSLKNKLFSSETRFITFKWHIGSLILATFFIYRMEQVY